MDLEMIEVEPLTLFRLRAEGLLTQEQETELVIWFEASCQSPEPLELPDDLYRALTQAVYLAQLDPSRAVMH